MAVRLPSSFFKILVVLFFVGASVEGFGQGCSGFDVTQPLGGSLGLYKNGENCVNKVGGLPGLLDITVTNVDDKNSAVIQFEINKDDGSAPYRVSAIPNPLELHSYSNSNANGGTSEQLTFLPGKCEYNPSVRLVVNGVTCGSLGIPPTFVRWNVDSELSGKLSLLETVQQVPVYNVCEGVETVVTFTDQSTLNCASNAFTNTLNQFRRWRQFVYGTSNTITGTVLVNGTSHVFPFTDVVNQSLDFPPTSIVTANQTPGFKTYQIKIPATAKEGEFFDITMNYWNTCNKYTDGDAPVTTIGKILVVKQPDAPTAGSPIVCNNSTLPDFKINIPVVSNKVFWYENAGGTPGTLITNTLGTNSSILKVDDYPGGITKTTAGSYTVFASYEQATQSQNLSCTSIVVPVTLTIREALPTITLPPTQETCFNAPLQISPAKLSSKTYGGTTEYVWSVDVNDVSSVSGIDDSRIFDFSGVNFGGAAFVHRKITVFERYTADHTCSSTPTVVDVTVYQPTIGGTLSPAPDVCSTTAISTITLTGNRGTVDHWEVDKGAGFLTDASLGNANSISPGILPAGNYKFRAMVANGPCTDEYSSVEEVEVFPNPSPATVGIDMALCQASLISPGLGGSDPLPGIGTWTMESGPGVVIGFIPDKNTPNAQAQVSTQGIYTFRWTVKNSICESHADIKVDFGTTPNQPTASTPLTFCDLTGALSGSAPTFETPVWSKVSGPGNVTFGNDASPTSSVSVDAYGTYQFKWTFNSGSGTGLCAPKSVVVDVKFNEPATATPPADFIACVDKTAFVDIPFSGTVGGGSGAATQKGKWIVDTGSGVLTDGNGVGPTINGSYKPVLADYNVGFVKLKLIAINDQGAPCTDVESSILTITFDKKPLNVSAGSDQLLLCISDPTLAGSVPLASQNETGEWSGPAGIGFDDKNVNTTKMSGLASSTPTTLTWTIRSQYSSVGGCAAVTDDVELFRNALPLVNSINPEVCEQTNGSGTAIVVLSVRDADVTSSAASTTVEWFTDPIPAGAVPSNTPKNLDNTLPNSLTFFTRVTNSVTTCQDIGTVVYTINPLPIPVPFAKDFCEDFDLLGNVGSNKVDNIDLTTADILTGVTGGAPNTIVDSWWEDATASTTAIGTPAAYSITASTVVYARIKNTITNCEAIAQVNLNIVPRPADQPIQGKLVVCLGATELYKVNPVAGATYQWTIPDPPFSRFLGGGPSDVLTLVEFPSVSSGDIKLKILVGGCAGKEIIKNVSVSPTPSTFVITRPDIDAVNGISNDQVCENDAGVPYAVNPDNFPSSTYNWIVTPAGGALIANGQTSGSVLVNFLSADVSIRVTESNSSNCFGPPQTINIRVNKRPELATISNEVCSKEPSGITLVETAASPVPAATYTITSMSIAPGLIQIFPAAPRATPFTVIASDLANDVFENTTGGPLDVRYTVQPNSIDGCPGPSKIVSLTVKPQPVLDPFLDVSRCSGKTTDIIFKVQVGSVAADLFLIDAITPEAGLTAIAGNPLTGSVNATAIADDVWQNLGLVPLKVVYTVRPTNSLLGCTGNPAIPVTVTVYPEPQVTPQTKVICSGESVNLPMLSNIGDTYSWTVKSATPGTTGATGGIGATINDVLKNTSGAPGQVVYSVKAKNPSSLFNCEGQSQDVSITVNPAPPVNVINRVVCSDLYGGSTIPMDLTTLQPDVNSDASLNFEWFASAVGSPLVVVPGSVIASPSTFTLNNNQTVYVKVDNGPSSCFNVATITYTINKKPKIQAAALVFNNFEIKCNGDANAQITATAAQGTAPYLFTINGGTDYFPVGNFNGLGPATYNIGVKDANGCLDESPAILIHEPTPLTFLAATTDARCFQDNSGTITITPSGGITTAAYTYSLNGSAFQPLNVFGSLLAGTYTVTVKDANGCTKSDPVVVGEPTKLKGSITNQVNVDCKGNTSGSVTVVATVGTGTAPYLYAIDALNFQGSGLFSGLPAGAYTITVKDANGCTTPVSVTITEPALLTLNLSNKIDASCFNTSDGSITVLGSGGTTPFEYSTDGITFQPTGVFSNLPGGITYHLTVRDAKLCTAVRDVKINQPAILGGSITSQLDVKCKGGNDGSVTVNGSGGSGIYEFSLDGAPFVTSGTFTGLTAISYTVTVRDQNLCSIPVPVSILEPTTLTGTIVTNSKLDVTCNGGNNGSIEIAGGGGVSPYQYSINGGTFIPSGIFTNLVKGSYVVKVRDKNSCSVDVPFVIGEPTSLSAIVNVTNVNCKGTATGKIEVTGQGGTPDATTFYSYSIDGSNFQTGATFTFTALATGNYLVRVRDANNCSINYPVAITEPTQVVTTVQNKTDVDCFGNNTGTVTIAATGGTPAPGGIYTYSSDNITFVPSPTFTGLIAGDYTFYAADANHCSAPVQVRIDEPTKLVLNLTAAIDILCNGLSTGSIIVQGAGGVGPYQYSIDGGPFSPLNTFNSLAAKPNYKLMVSDVNNCQQTIFVPIAQPAVISIGTVVPTDAKCFLGSDGTITITSSGGTAPLKYTVLQDPSNITGKDNGVFTGLRAGTFTVLVTDANNCTKTSAAVVVGQPAQLNVAATVASDYNGFGVSCEHASDGIVQGMITSGGTGPTFTYSISPNPNSVASNTTGTFGGLPTGFYTISLTDNNGCPATSIPVLLTEPFTLSAGFIGFDQFVCVGNDPDVVKEIVPPFGGIGVYTYQWQQSIDNAIFADIPGATAKMASYDPPATITQTTYFKRIVTSGTCAKEESNVVKVTINPLPSAAISPSDSPICEGGTFFLNLTFTGQPPFRYDYDATAVSAGTTTSFTNLIGAATTPVPVFDYKETTTYTIVHVKDFNGCESDPVGIFTTVPVIKIDPTFTIISPGAQCSGSLFSFSWKVDAGVKYTWIWPDGQQQIIGPDDAAFPPGQRSVDHLMTNGLTSTSIFLPVVLQAANTLGPACSTQATKTVEVYPAVKALVPPIANVICSGDVVDFDNITQGATIHKWYYRVKGSSDENFVEHTFKVSYKFENELTANPNPIVYEVVYEGSNSNNCSDRVTLDVTVYKKSVADFTFDNPVPPFVGGTSTLNFVNTSSIIDATLFSYGWTLGDAAVPTGYADNATVNLPPTVYHTPGDKTVTLTVINRAEPRCFTVATFVPKILVPPFTASFTATPLASCLPTEIVVNNTSGQADSFEWTLSDGEGNVVSVSTVNQPKFSIASADTYTINMTATLISSGQHADATPVKIEVYPNPLAFFSVRSKEIFIPDVPLLITNGSTGATEYDWDFGDGSILTQHEPDKQPPQHFYKDAGKFVVQLIAINNHGDKDIGGGIIENITCADSVAVEIVTRDGGSTRIPNAFTPNRSGPGANGDNDVFLPIMKGIDEFEMQIYDRWGTLHFISKDKTIGWDGYDKNGSLLPAGVYVYKLTLKLSNGQRTTQVGDVTLIR